MISDRFHLSVTYLNQLFKQELSVTIKQYISEMRMERARELLTQTYDTVDEIAAKCGYSNGNYFAKAFRENQHMSPTDYRKQMEKETVQETAAAVSGGLCAADHGDTGDHNVSYGMQFHSDAAVYHGSEL